MFEQLARGPTVIMAIVLLAVQKLAKLTNAALNERAYTDKEWTDVQDFKVELTKDAEGVLYR